MAKQSISETSSGDPIRLTVKTSACQYLDNLRRDEALFFLWDVDGVSTPSGWTAIAFAENKLHSRLGRPFVTSLRGVKVVVPEAQRVENLNGRTLSYEWGKLLVT